MKINMYKQSNWILRLVAVLFLLVMLSIWALSGLLARYTNMAAIHEMAHVASFQVRAVGNKENLSVDIGKESPSAAFEIAVYNDSEVAVSYDIVLHLSSILPDGISVTLDGKAPVLSEDKRTLNFMNAGMLSIPDADTKLLLFTVDRNLFAALGAAERYEVSQNIDIKVNFTQID